jgi:hypothetical protein
MASLGPQLCANDVQMRFVRNRGQNKVFDLLNIFGPHVVQNGPEMAHSSLKVIHFSLQWSQKLAKVILTM